MADVVTQLNENTKNEGKWFSGFLPIVNWTAWKKLPVHQLAHYNISTDSHYSEFDQVLFT